MKRFSIIFVSLALFAGFLAIKPPALATKNKTPVSTTTNPVATPSTGTKQPPAPTNGKPALGKPGVTVGEEDDDGGRSKEKPSYGGHDEDDYDD
jgi:hypothetical protein